MKPGINVPNVTFKTRVRDESIEGSNPFRWEDKTSEDFFKGKRVVDFACGSGLVGIAAMKAGATSCHAVDIDAFALTATRMNAALNDVEVTTETADITAGEPPEADLVFCGDVFYDKPMADKVLAFLDRLLTNGIEVYVGDPGRSYLPSARLTELAAYSVPVVGALEDSEIKRTRVFRLEQKSSAK